MRVVPIGIHDIDFLIAVPIRREHDLPPIWRPGERAVDEISGKVSHSGEGLWTVETAKEMGIPAPIIEGSLKFREESQEKPSYTGQVVSALRNQFGGHEVKKKK